MMQPIQFELLALPLEGQEVFFLPLHHRMIFFWGELTLSSLRSGEARVG